MPVAVVQVVEVVPVLDCVAAVAVCVRTRVLSVHFAFFVLLAVVEMVRMVVMLNRCAPVAGQVLMVKFLGVRVHENPLVVGIPACPGSRRNGKPPTPCV